MNINGQELRLIAAGLADLICWPCTAFVCCTCSVARCKAIAAVHCTHVTHTHQNKSILSADEDQSNPCCRLRLVQLRDRLVNSSSAPGAIGCYSHTAGCEGPWRSLVLEKQGQPRGSSLQISSISNCPQGWPAAGESRYDGMNDKLVFVKPER
ncbi:hypothetical protein HDV57DRAFT_70905 [Trichoderma longibrachiatum]